MKHRTKRAATTTRRECIPAGVYARGVLHPPRGVLLGPSTGAGGRRRWGLEPALDEHARRGVGVERSELDLSRGGVDLAAMPLEHFCDQRLAHATV